MYEFVGIGLERLFDRFKRVADGAFALLRGCQDPAKAADGRVPTSSEPAIPWRISAIPSVGAA